MLTYADAADVLAEDPDVDLDAASLARYCRSASALIRVATRLAIYGVTPAGAPDDTDVAQAFKDAVVAQVLAWAALGVNPATGTAGVTGQVASTSLLSGSVTFTQRAGADQDKAATISALVPDAAAALDALGLLSGQPATW